LILNQDAMGLLAASARYIRGGGQYRADQVQSPCVSVCQMDEETALCQGCLRTLDEICQWGNADDAQRRAIWLNIEARVAQYST